MYLKMYELKQLNKKTLYYNSYTWYIADITSSYKQFVEFQLKLIVVILMLITETKENKIFSTVYRCFKIKL